MKVLTPVQALAAIHHLEINIEYVNRVLHKCWSKSGGSFLVIIIAVVEILNW